jgi:hypothetical protein
MDPHGNIRRVPAPNRRISPRRRGSARRLLRRSPTSTGPAAPKPRVGRDRIATPPADDLSGPHAVELAGLLHELTVRLLGAEGFAQALDRLAAFAAGAVPGAVRCSVALIGEGGPLTIAGHGTAGQRFDQIQYATSTGPGLDAARTRAVVTARDLSEDPRWPALAEAACADRLGSVVAVPLDVHRVAVGALSLYAEAADGIDPGMLLTAMAVANQAEVLLGELRRRDVLVEGAAVDRAAGVIIAQRNCSVPQAYAFLQDTAQRLGLDRRTLANRLIAAVARDD